MHIPKTGGTSFRKSLMAAQPRDYNLLDYGLEAPETSRLIKETIYSQPKIPLRDRIGSTATVLVSGHFPAHKYDLELPNAFRIAFVRYPVAQVVSHHRHHVARLGYTGTLSDFCRTASFQNVQSQYLGQSAAERFDFIGVLEWFAFDMAVLSDRLGTRIPPLHLNKLSSPPATMLTGAEVEMIQSYNAEDMALFAAVVSRRGRGAGLPKNGAARREVVDARQ